MMTVAEQAEVLWKGKRMLAGSLTDLVKYAADLAVRLFAGENGELGIFEDENGLTVVHCERPTGDDLRTVLAAHKPHEGTIVITEAHRFSPAGHEISIPQRCWGIILDTDSREVASLHLDSPDGEARMHTADTSTQARLGAAIAGHTLALLLQDGNSHSDVFAANGYALRQLRDVHSATRPAGIFYHPAIRAALPAAFPS